MTGNKNYAGNCIDEIIGACSPKAFGGSRKDGGDQPRVKEVEAGGTGVPNGFINSIIAAFSPEACGGRRKDYR